MVAVYICGYWSDKIKVWKVVSIVNVIISVFLGLMLWDLFSNDCDDLSIWYDVGYCGAECMMFT